jgi:virginiamycin B lyase
MHLAALSVVVSISVMASLTVHAQGAITSHQIAAKATIREFPITTPHSYPFGITQGPDGALWFTESNVNQIGRIARGGSIREFPITTPHSSPLGISRGEGDALWFTESDGNKIGWIR